MGSKAESITAGYQGLTEGFRQYRGEHQSSTECRTNNWGGFKAAG
jgi:hypothetical protein